MKLFDPDKPFYKGNLHTHTTRSDGRKSPEEVMAEYAAHGYDFLALTDHWKVGGAEQFGSMLVLSGAEYDFFFKTQTLHLVALFRDAKDGADILRGADYRDVIDLVNRRGGIGIAAHPAWSLNTPDFLVHLDGVNLAEVYNTVSDEPYNPPRADASSLLDVTAANGKLYGFLAADDAHYYVGEQCVSYIMLQADELSVDGIFRALRAGKFYATQGPKFFDVELTDTEMTVRHSPAAKCTFVSNVYWTPDRSRVGDGMTENTYQLVRNPDRDHPRNERFIRCVITDAQGRRAWTSPIAIP